MSDACPPSHMDRLYRERQSKHQHRLYQGRRVRDVLTNQIDVVFKDVVRPGDEPVVGNLVTAAARTIAQRVGRMPRLDVQADDSTSDKMLESAEKHEKRLVKYGTKMNVAATRLQAAFWLVTHDMAPLVVAPSPMMGIPCIEVRDPLTCFPGNVWPHKPEVVDVLFVEEMTAWAAGNLYPQVTNIINAMDDQVEMVKIGEYFDDNGVTVAMLEPRLCPLDFIPNPVRGRSLVVMTRGFSPDLGYHGQFDNVISALIAQAKLFGLALAYAAQQVAAETVVVGEIVSNQGKWATGPGAVNQITPMPGAQAQKLTNNMSVQVFNELDRLERAIRLGGGFPAQLSGEPVASIATGRGLEQLTVTVDDNVAYWQTVLDDAFMRAYNLVPQVARAMAAHGSEDFADPSDVNVYVRSLSGADPAETVRLLQLQGAKNISRATIMERLPEVDQPMKELERMDIDEMRGTLIRSLEMQVQTGQIQADAVAQLIKRRKNGEDIEEIWEDLQKIQMEQQQQAAQQMGAMQPGGQGQGAGQAPPLDQLLNPANLAGQAASQGIRAARTESPEANQIRQALMGGGGPQPGAGVPGPAGVPA